MPDYRTCVRGEKGAILRSYSFSASDDQAALEKIRHRRWLSRRGLAGRATGERLEQSLAVKSFPPRRRF